LGALSFFINKDGKTIGHFAFIRVDQEMRVATLGLVYLRPEYRRTGISREIVELAEKTAMNLLDTKTMLLNVMSLNVPAHNLYLKAGYLAYEKTDDLVRMKKEIQ
jgi:GNAT superfamily N-acetyltransferase